MQYNQWQDEADLAKEGQAGQDSQDDKIDEYDGQMMGSGLSDDEPEFVFDEVY